MHARHRGPVTAYNRSNSMRMVGGGHVPAMLRISPEGSIRGHHEMYNSEYRSYNRDGFGHVQPKHFPTRDPSPRRSDVFMEAGRMAAEYLVSKGLLPQSVLVGKGQNGNLRSYNPGFRTQEGGDMQPLPVGPGASRPSALSRLGNHVPDIVPGRKRYSDEYGAAGPNKSQFRGRRRNGYYKDSDWNRDTGRSGSYSKRSRASSPDTDDRHVDSSVHQDEKKVAKGSTKRIQETCSDANAACDSELALEKHNSMGDKATKESSNSSGKDLSRKDEAEDVQMSTNMETSASEVEETKSGNDNDFTHSHVELRVEEGTHTSKKGTDLLSLCGYENVPRRTRSSLTVRRSKVICDAVTVEEEKDTNECVQPTEFEEIPLNLSFNQDCDNKSPDYVIPSVTLSEERNGAVHSVEEENTSSLSFTDGTVIKVPEKVEELEDENKQEQNTKSLELTTPDDVQSDCFFYHSGLEEKEKLQNLHHPNGNIMQSDDFEEKQLFSGTFKTCDLNLMEAADVNENHDIDTDLIFPSIIESRKESAPVDIDLSINNSCGIPDKYNSCGLDRKFVEVIDLENDSEQEGKPFDDQLGSSITELTSRDGYANNNANSVNEIGDIHDGYGLMLSELLGNDIPNCSSVPGGEDMSVLHNDMGLHNGGGLLGDDDSIYMSLGEIPMSFPWEQPPQEYRRPF